jgi:hypothetical protein
VANVAVGRTFPFRREGGKVRRRRIFSVAAGSGECPFTIRLPTLAVVRCKPASEPSESKPRAPSHPDNSIRSPIFPGRGRAGVARGRARRVPSGGGAVPRQRAKAFDKLAAMPAPADGGRQNAVSAGGAAGASRGFPGGLRRPRRRSVSNASPAGCRRRHRAPGAAKPAQQWGNDRGTDRSEEFGSVL